MNEISGSAITDQTRDVPSKAETDLVAPHTSIGQALIAHAKLGQKDVDRILLLQQEKNILFGEAAKQLGLIKDSDLKKVLSEQYAYDYLHDTGHLHAKLVAAYAPFTPEAEKLRSLRGQLMMRWFEHGNKTLAITSTEESDQANLLAANLAIVFSQLNKKTLLMDANLRLPSQHRLFGIKTRVGLSNLLANREGQYQLARPASLPNLSILTAGTEVPNPQELLSKSNFSELLLDLEKVFDVILVDTSPSSFGSDYLSVIAKAKACIVVTRKDYTLASELHALVEQLNVAGITPIGSVLQEF